MNLVYSYGRCQKKMSCRMQQAMCLSVARWAFIGLGLGGFFDVFLAAFYRYIHSYEYLREGRINRGEGGGVHKESHMVQVSSALIWGFQARATEGVVLS